MLAVISRESRDRASSRVSKPRCARFKGTTGALAVGTGQRRFRSGVQTWREGSLRPSGLKCYNPSLHAPGGTEEQQHATTGTFTTNRAPSETEQFSVRRSSRVVRNLPDTCL